MPSSSVSLHAQRHVGLQFRLQPVPQLAAGDVLALAAGQRRVVDAEVHGQRRLVDLEHRQRRGIGRVGDGHADADLLDAADQHDVAGPGLRRRARRSSPSNFRICCTLASAGVPSDAFIHGDLLVHLDRALVDAAHADAARRRSSSRATRSAAAAGHRPRLRAPAHGSGWCRTAAPGPCPTARRRRPPPSRPSRSGPRRRPPGNPAGPRWRRACRTGRRPR